MLSYAWLGKANLVKVKIGYSVLLEFNNRVLQFDITQKSVVKVLFAFCS